MRIIRFRKFVDMATQKKTFAKLSLLVSILQGSKFHHIDELTKKLNLTSAKQTGRLIDDLLRSGFLVERKEGKESSWRIFDKQKQQQTVFSIPEHQAIFEALKPSGLTKELKEKVNRLIARCIENNYPHYDTYQTILQAIQKRKMVVINQYTPYGKPSERKECSIADVDLVKGRCYAWNSKMQKFYSLNLERMHEVKISTKNIEDHPKWEDVDEPCDVFGFTKTNTNGYKVDLTMTESAASLLIRQFPETASCFTILKHEKEFNHSFKTHAHHSQPITRFIVSLLDQVRIHGDDELKKVVREYFERLQKEKMKNLLP